MSFPTAHRALLALLTAGALAAAIGACAAETTRPGGGDGADFALGGGYDQGAASDAGAQFSQVTLLTPSPFQSSVATSTEFQFLTTLPGAMTPQALEPFVQVTPYPTGRALAGAFSWRSTGPSSYQLNFLPAALADHSDYVVTVADPSGSGTLLKTGISTGSNPRVIDVKLAVAAHANSVSTLVTFSEAMVPSSISASLVLTASGTPVPGTVSEPAGAADHLHFQFGVTSPHNLAMPLRVIVKSGAMAAAQGTLTAMSWDSTTDDGSGNFFWTPKNAPSSFDSLSTDTIYEFVPTVY